MNCDYCNLEMHPESTGGYYGSQYVSNHWYECLNNSCDGAETVKCKICGCSKHDGVSRFITDLEGDYPVCLSCDTFGLIQHGKQWFELGSKFLEVF